MRLVRSRLARLRLKAGYDNAQQAADAIGISRIHLLKVEQGSSRMSSHVMERMAEVYKVHRATIEDAMNYGWKELMKRRLANG